MKNMIFSLAALGILYMTDVSAQTGQERQQAPTNQQQQEGEAWQSSEDQTWRGADNMWYRRDGENIMQSEDGTTWERTENNTFQSYDGTWYRYENGELRSSPDGLGWEEAEDWSDQDGRSFRFDEGGELQTREGSNELRGAGSPGNREGM